ncbi:MAG: SIR2 family protein [Chloroflexota bacterium]
MPVFDIPTLKQSKKGWKATIVERIHRGKVLPLISNVVSNRLVFERHKHIVDGWARYIDYPFADQHDLTQMTQYQKVLSKADPEIRADNDYIKQIYLSFIQMGLFSIAEDELVEELQENAQFNSLSFSQKAEQLNMPAFDEGPNNPLLLLADMPLPIYLTTSYHTFIESALIKAGKKPRTEFCRWHTRLESLPTPLTADYVPSDKEPLVFHLHGVDQHPESLVLTEDDHLDFLVTISRDPEVVPKRVHHALADSSLIMLGYSLQHWDFRTIFRTLIKGSDTETRLKSVFIQLLDNQHEKHFLQSYLAQEAEFEVVWGETGDFLQEIYQGWQES